MGFLFCCIGSWEADALGPGGPRRAQVMVRPRAFSCAHPIPTVRAFHSTSIKDVSHVGS